MKDCKFYKPNEQNKAIGTCHRFPPQSDLKGMHTVDEFPTVKNLCWCGEFKKGAKK